MTKVYGRLQRGKCKFVYNIHIGIRICNKEMLSLKLSVFYNGNVFLILKVKDNM